MGGQYGVQETIDVLDFAFTSISIAEDVLADGKIGLLELGKLLPLIPKALNVLNGVVFIPKELAELDAADQEQLLSYFQSRLPDVTDNEKIQAIATAYLKVVADLAEAIRLTVA
jgi:hypothetical protein